MPGSPLTTTSWPRRASAWARASRSCWRTSSRPTTGIGALMWPPHGTAFREISISHQGIGGGWMWCWGGPCCPGSRTTRWPPSGGAWPRRGGPVGPVLPEVENHSLAALEGALAAAGRSSAVVPFFGFGDLEETADRVLGHQAPVVGISIQSSEGALASLSLAWLLRRRRFRGHLV